MEFIVPSAPVLKTSVPVGEDWLHEPKIHKRRDGVRLYTRSGKALLGRFEKLVTHLRPLPSCVLDVELVDIDADGMPMFPTLKSNINVCVYAFDLLGYGPADLRSQPIEERRRSLIRIVEDAGIPLLRYTEAFKDGHALLEATELMGFEGVVSKRQGQPYVSGKNPSWVKVKTKAWKKTHAERAEKFNKVR